MRQRNKKGSELLPSLKAGRPAYLFNNPDAKQSEPGIFCFGKDAGFVSSPQGCCRYRLVFLTYSFKGYHWVGVLKAFVAVMGG
jgi:hypothetical protein